MWVNGKRVKENWHAKKKASKLREMKKSGNNIPKTLEKNLLISIIIFIIENLLENTLHLKASLK